MRGFKSHLRRFFNWFYGEIDSNLQFEFSNPRSNLVKSGILKTSANTFFQNLEKNKITEEKNYQKCDVLDVVTLLNIASKTAGDIVKNNNQVILLGLEAGSFSMIGTHDNDYNKES